MVWLIVLSSLIVLLLVGNLAQLLSRRSARRLADVLYIVSRRVRDKATEVREHQLDPEIIEAHLMDVEGFVLGLQQALGRKKISLIHDSPTPPPRFHNRAPKAVHCAHKPQPVHSND